MNPTSPNPASPSATAGSAPEKPSSGGTFKDTLNLPKTAFPMKASLVQNEPASLKRWSGLGGGGLYGLLRDRHKATPAPKGRFVFHDGPPYANGSIHTGHLLNKCLKDFVVRSRTMMGYDVPYVPGWDCHGLPIEHKVMTEMVEKGKWDKVGALPDGQRQMVVRRECQAYAEKFIKLQSGQMQRLLTLADYADPYLTMKPAFEGATLEVLAGLLDAGLVYRALKPVHWSIANQTALAEAELEYEDRTDLSVYVDFEAENAQAVYDAFGLPPDNPDDDTDESDETDDAAGGEKSRAPRPGLRPLQTPCLMIWTTTPWTLPANLAIAVNPAFEYALVWVDGNVTILATALLEKVMQNARAEEVVILARTTGDKLLGLRYRHPFVDKTKGEGVWNNAFGDTSKVWAVVGADYVTLEDGTGLVHTAPGHGAEDYQTGLREGLPVYCPVKADGHYDATAPAWLHGMDVWAANAAVAKRLRDQGNLFYEHTFNHSYPHDWRSKTPTIFRCTEQWFVGVDKPGSGPLAGASLRSAALAATAPDAADKVGFYPEWGRNRMRGMLESRPDWCISRQRAWGLPIPAFFLPDGSVFMTPATVRAAAAVFRAKGSDAWFSLTPAELLANYTPASDPHAPAALRSGAVTTADLRKGGDILDVWFESGSTWNAVMRERSGGADFPVELYLEGSDQHRGWFQTSLLPSLGVTGRPPFKALLTHGFVVDKDGRKMSKSLGNALEVEDMLKDYGADVCRWWASSVPYENDVKMDKAYLDLAGESYRKVRNVLRFLLSNLYDFLPDTDAGKGHTVPVADIPPASLDAWALSAFDALAARVLTAYQQYDFQTVHTAIFDFCNDTLSAKYLAATKDRLYCDRADSPRRRRTQTVMWHIAHGLCRLLAPVMPHTADEAYRSLYKVGEPGRIADPMAEPCVHFQFFPEPSGLAPAPAWAAFFTYRDRLMQTLEKARAATKSDPLEWGMVIPAVEPAVAGLGAVDIADLLGISRVTLDPAATEPAAVHLASEPRCERSLKRDGTVKPRPGRNNALLCDRCAEVLSV
ncbi:MAG: isoleucine--tRNA ligase [Planctomycetaceae bacterium]|jgi:isoleucyl-tRNA synthetase|nr:isoleucine--tRNA ligase [Phycisphaerales bacterium]MCE2654200.1 isoleucine--tRNA ligase [Planctomycetaceae bacterium]